MVEKEVTDWIIQTIKDDLNVGKQMEMNGETTISEIGIDSIGIMTLLVCIEEKYGFELEEDIFMENNFKNISDISSYILDKIQIVK